MLGLAVAGLILRAGAALLTRGFLTRVLDTCIVVVTEGMRGRSARLVLAAVRSSPERLRFKGAVDAIVFRYECDSHRICDLEKCLFYAGKEYLLIDGLGQSLPGDAILGNANLARNVTADCFRPSLLSLNCQYLHRNNNCLSN